MTIVNIRPGTRWVVVSRGVTPAELTAIVNGLAAVTLEVTNARDGLADLDTRLDALRDAGLATQAEVTAAREGEASLDVKLDIMETAAAATTAEVVAARDGLADLDTRLDALRDAGLATQAEVTAAREGEASLDVKLDIMETAAAATTAEVVAARSGAASLDARIDGIAADLDVAEVSIYEAAEKASYAKFDAERRNRDADLPKALVLILLGQSNNSSMGTKISTVVSNDAYMPVGGNFNTTGETFNGTWLASAVVHSEGPDESPLSGAITTLIGGNFLRIYAVTVAVGGRTLDKLGQGQPRCNLYAAAYRLCDLARAAGYNPHIVYSTHQGESDAAALASETDYYDDGRRFYRMAQCCAAQAMDKPDYAAPIVFHHPIAMYYGTDGDASRVINTAIRRLAKDIPNAIYGGSCYWFASNSDRLHNSPAGFRNRGEHVGYLLRRYVSETIRELPLEIVDVTWSGNTATVLFNHEVTRDTNFDWGTNLNTANALAGFEWLDNGAYIQITAVTVQGRKAVLTLASTPVGTLEQQKLRIASQTTTTTPTVGSNNLSGSQMRVNETGRASIYSYGSAAYGTHYRWAIPQLCDVRAA